MLPIDPSFLLIIALTLINGVNSEPLNALPLSIEKGNVVINAALTDAFTGKKYWIREYISSDSKIRGKIAIKTDENSFDIFYNNRNRMGRLVIADNNCDLFTWHLRWDKRLKGVQNELINDVLMVGPSLIYRLGDQIFQIQNTTVALNGVPMTVAKATISSRLSINYYYRASPGNNFDTIKPSRVELIDREEHYRSDVILEIISITRTDQQLDKVVTPTPGVGCPVYLTDGLPQIATHERPFLSQDYRRVHYIENVETTGPKVPTERIEAYFSEFNLIAYIKRWRNTLEEAIYDYKRGIIYTFDRPECLISPMTSATMGIDRSGLVNLESFLQIDTYERYVGQIFFEHRSGSIVDVYESFKANDAINGRRYDKVVKTFYYTPNDNKTETYRDVLVGATYNGYNKSKTGGYDLMETTKRDFYVFKTQTGSDIFEAKFNLDTCYPDPEEHTTIAIYITCEEKECIRLAMKEYELFRNAIKRKIAAVGVSIARLKSMELVFENDRIIAYTTVLPFPDITYAFKSDYKYIDLKNSLITVKPGKTRDECFNRLATSWEPFKAVLYCDDKGVKTCAKTARLKNLKESPDGTFCDVWYTPLDNFRTYLQEIPSIQLSDMLNQQKFRLFYDNEIQSILYEITRAVIVDNKKLMKGVKFNFDYEDSKLREEDESVQVTSVSMPNDCFKLCGNDDSCEVFSYCQVNGKIMCSTSNSSDVIFQLRYDQNCKAFLKERLTEYTKIPKRMFKNPPSEPLGTMSTRECASKCFLSNECSSFQYCDDKCTFAGNYTDAGTQISETCDIYIPKVTHKYRASVGKIVSQVFATELNLNLDQCAALCYDHRDGDEICRSFNYCPKDADKCQLTKYSIEESSTDVVDSVNCQNYELVDNRYGTNTERQSNELNNGSASFERGGSIFGIIILFLVTGSILGIVTPHVAIKSKKLLSQKTSTFGYHIFSWSKESDTNVNA